MEARMHIERLPAGTDLRARFSGLHQLFSTEGGAVNVADEKGAPVVITDESTLADVLGEYEDAIAVRRFDSRKARDLFAASCNPNATFKVRARQRQAEFRETLSAAARAGYGHPFLLGPSTAEKNLFPAMSVGNTVMTATSEQ